MCAKKKIIILPEEIIVEILSRISPVKSLMRFKCVCKSWLSLISTDSNFINKHLSHQIQNDEYDLLVLEGDWFTWSDLSFSTYNSKTYNQITTFQFPIEPVECLYVIGTYNGLFLLQITYDWGLMLFNPTTRELKSIPIDQPKHQSQCPNKDLGFGYDSFKEDYKIVTRYHANDMPNSCEAFVYSFAMNSWRIINGEVAKDYDISCSNQVVVNGCIHWLGNCWIKKDEFIIIAFDLHKEEFEKMEVPDCKIQKCESRLGELQGCLSIFVVDHFDQFDKFDIWAMKYYGSSKSWTKQITFTWPILCPSLLGFGRDGKVFFSQLLDDKTRYIWYDPKNKQVIKEFIDEDFDHLSISFSYIKSLIPVKLIQEEFK